MKSVALIVLCSGMALSTAAFAQEAETQPGYLTVNIERGNPVARVTDPVSNNTLVASCTDGVIGFNIRYGALTMQQAPDQVVTVSFETHKGKVEVPATSTPSEGMAITSADATIQGKIREAFRSFIGMTSDEIGTVTISDEQAGSIGTLAVSGKGSTAALGRVMKGCEG